MTPLVIIKRQFVKQTKPYNTRFLLKNRINIIYLEQSKFSP